MARPGRRAHAAAVHEKERRTVAGLEHAHGKRRVGQADASAGDLHRTCGKQTPLGHLKGCCWGVGCVLGHRSPGVGELRADLVSGWCGLGRFADRSLYREVTYMRAMPARLSAFGAILPSCTTSLRASFTSVKSSRTCADAATLPDDRFHARHAGGGRYRNGDNRRAAPTLEHRPQAPRIRNAARRGLPRIHRSRSRLSGTSTSPRSLFTRERSQV